MHSLKYCISKFVLLVAFMLQASLCYAGNMRALIIGIGKYPEGSGWNEIHGDSDIDLIKNALLKQGFIAENIVELRNEAATKSAIISAFSLLQQYADKEDVIYIHFSGHGQQITDLNGDEEDGWDEAWIPYDARKEYSAGVYEGKNHLIDDELNKILMKFRVKIGPSGKIVVVADACHSGSGSRGLHYDDEDDFVRGTTERFYIPRDGANKHAKADPEEWLLVAACKPNETNHEYRDDSGVWYGTLSYVISQDDSDLSKSKYADVLKEWNETVRNINKRARDIMNDGQPSRRSSYLF